jgi:hypothetical protein
MGDDTSSQHSDHHDDPLPLRTLVSHIHHHPMLLFSSHFSSSRAPIPPHNPPFSTPSFDRQNSQDDIHNNDDNRDDDNDDDCVDDIDSKAHNSSLKFVMVLQQG